MEADAFDLDPNAPAAVKASPSGSEGDALHGRRPFVWTHGHHKPLVPAQPSESPDFSAWLQALAELPLHALTLPCMDLLHAV